MSDQNQKNESPSTRQRRLQDEAENRGDVLPAITIDDDGNAVRKKPNEVRRGQDAKESSTFDHKSSHEITVPKYDDEERATKYEPAFGSKSATTTSSNYDKPKKSKYKF